MTYSSNKDIDRLVRQELRNGARYARGSKHGKLILPCGARVVFSRSPGDRRAFQNFRGQIRRSRIQSETISTGEFA
ncbi:hypothetical protein BMG03_10570 [Thioclava nitratireducens]|uniref:Uncharacterized protein n=1 Tax=Thioclava nitratireducens TaxID=1915078 RepID=A0ABN4XHS1_9RHOB|nr:hypothetical protein BMG03_10570 [Thioclava nitratireducens]